MESVLSRKTREESRRVTKDEKSSLVSHEYDTVCTEDELSLSPSQSERGRTRSSPQPREIEAEYSEIRRDFISNRNSHSRSMTPTDSLVSGIRAGAVSYGAVSGETDEDRPYSYIQVGKERRGRQPRPHSRSKNSDSQPPASDVSDSGYATRTRVTTSILQVGAH